MGSRCELFAIAVMTMPTPLCIFSGKHDGARIGKHLGACTPTQGESDGDSDSDMCLFHRTGIPRWGAVPPTGNDDIWENQEWIHAAQAHRASGGRGFRYLTARTPSEAKEQAKQVAGQAKLCMQHTALQGSTVVTRVWGTVWWLWLGANSC